MEIKDRVIKKYQIGNLVKMRIDNKLSITANIISFNSDTVLTEHDGYKESFTYWDFLQMTTPREIKQSELFMSEGLGRRRKEEQS